MADPKGDYIPIDSIDDLDPAGITIRDLNKRYIDRNGNRYATRFNLQNRRVEIVQIVKGMHEAQRIKQQRQVDRVLPGPAVVRRSERREPEEEEPDMLEEQMDDSVFDEEVDTGGASAEPPGDVAPFIEQQFIDEVEADFERVKQRQQGVLNNLKNSGAFVGDLDDKLAGVAREMENDAWGHCETAINYSKELRSYPRPVSYYATKLANDKKEQLEAVEEDKRLALIRRWELQKTFETAFLAVQNAGQNAAALIGELDPAGVERLAAVQRQNLEDAKTSLDFLLSGVAEKLNKIKHWRHRYGG